MSSTLQEHGPAATGDAPPRDAEYERAHERAKALQGLYIHLLVFAVINAGLFLINWAMRGPDGAWWFYWPLLGWGVAVAIHLVTAFVPVFSPDWADRRAERMLEGRVRHGS
jgi:two-component system, LytTR family, sensor kinase